MVNAISLQALSAELSQTSVGEELTADELDWLAKAGRIKPIAAGKVLLAVEEQYDGLWVLLTGQIAAVAKSAFEEDRVISLVEAGESFGNLGFLTGEITLPVRFQVRCDSRFFVLPSTAIQDLDAFGDIRQVLAEHLAERLELRLRSLIEGVVAWLREQDARLETPDSAELKTARTELETLQNRLLERATQLQFSRAQVQAELHPTAAPEAPPHRRIPKRLIFAMGAIAAFLSVYLLTWLSYGSRAKQPPYPTVIPYIDTPEECAKRFGSTWQDEKCYDYEHDPQF